MLTDSSDTTADDLQHALYDAILECDLAQVSELLSQGVSLTHAKFEGHTLDCAANNLSLLKLLLGGGIISVNDLGADEATLLHRACFGCPRPDVVDYLLDFIDPNTKCAKGETPLHHTLALGRFRRESLEVVNRLLQAGANPNEADHDGETPLMLSVSLPEVFQALLSAGADPTAVCRKGYSVLYRAAMHSEDLVRTLLALGESANQTLGNMQTTPLHSAVSNDEFGVVKALIEYGADVNARDATGVRPLNIATKRDFGDIVQWLLANGAVSSTQEEIDRATERYTAEKERNKANQKPLLKQAIDRGDISFFATTVRSLMSGENPKDIQQIAVEVVTHCDHVAFLSALVDLGMNPHHIDDGFTLLHDAALNNRTQIAKFLLAAGLNPNARTADGRTMYHCALSSSPELMQVLLQHGMKIAMSDNYRHFDIVIENLNPKLAQWLLDRGDEIHMITIKNVDLIKHVINQDCSDTFAFLLNNGLARVAHDEKIGGLNSLLAYAVERNAKNVVKLLLEHRTDPNAHSSDGKPVIYSALDVHNEAIIERLIEHGADVNLCAAVFGESLLQEAINNGNARIAQLLIKSGANVVHTGGFDKNTPLHCAAKRGYLKTAQMLVSAGADPHCEDKRGKTALDVAIDHERAEVARFLREEVGA